MGPQSSWPALLLLVIGSMWGVCGRTFEEREADYLEHELVAIEGANDDPKWTKHFLDRYVEQTLVGKSENELVPPPPLCLSLAHSLTHIMYLSSSHHPHSCHSTVFVVRE